MSNEMKEGSLEVLDRYIWLLDSQRNFCKGQVEHGMSLPKRMGESLIEHNTILFHSHSMAINTLRRAREDIQRLT